MQTPVGYFVNTAGQFETNNWWTVIFNPSFGYRLVHMVLAAYLTTSLMVGAVAAWHLSRDSANAHARLMFSMAMWMAALVAPLQIIAGDLHGLNTLEHQPAKIAAMEGHFESQTGAPLILFGVPDQEERVVHYAVKLPHIGSLILTHDWDGELKGLDAWPREDWPNVPIVFWSFRIMVGLGFAMVGLGLWSLWARWRGRLYDLPALRRAALLMGPSGFVALLAGWVVTEVGRQPYTVYGLLRTAESASPLDTPAVAGSLLAFIVVYFAVFGAGVFYLVRLMRTTPSAQVRGPDSHLPTPAAGTVPGPASLGTSASAAELENVR
jgi:cytochrome d ubiquinol oxidase subunit I